MRVALPLFVVLLFLAPGCGAPSERSDDGMPGATVATVTGPTGPPPKLDMEGPPPAWAETSAGAVWLGYSSYCWETACADYIAPACGDKRVPDLRVEQGGTIRFHFGFTPKTVSVAFFGSGDNGVPLPPGRTAAWRVSGEGPLVLMADAGGGRDASYVACVRLGGSSSGTSRALSVEEAGKAAPGSPIVVEGSLLADSAGIRLCSALGESHPPTCSGAALEVRGLDPATLERLAPGRTGHIRWSDRPVRLAGSVAGGMLVVERGGG